MKTRKNLTSEQLSVLLDAWGKGMRSAQSDLVQKVRRQTGLREGTVKRWIYNRNRSLQSVEAKLRTTRSDSFRKHSGYHMFCSSLKQTNIADFGAKWKALSKCDQKLWKDKALHKNRIPVELRDEKDKSWLCKKAFKCLNAACTLLEKCGTTVAGMTLCNNRVEIFGSDKGQEFLTSHANVHFDFVNYMQKGKDVLPKQNTSRLRQRVRKIFNVKYTQACGAIEEKKFPYKNKSNIIVEGLPNGIILKDPNLYGSNMCKRIIDVENDIKFFISSSPSNVPELLTLEIVSEQNSS